MVSPCRPAAYTRYGATGDVSALALAAAQHGLPAPQFYGGLGAHGGGQVLESLEAALSTGRHDVLLMALPAALANPTRLMRLLTSCTRHGVRVVFVPAGGAVSAGWLANAGK
jgi:hypothetical protein